MNFNPLIETYAKWWFAPETNIAAHPETYDHYEYIRILIADYIERVDGLSDLERVKFAISDDSPGHYSYWSKFYGYGASRFIASDGTYECCNVNNKFVCDNKNKRVFDVVYDKDSSLFIASWDNKTVSSHLFSGLLMFIKNFDTCTSKDTP